jgi:DNA-binding NarL/FixJ family response regulator
LKPHVVLMDVRLPDGTGIEACREIRAVCPDTQVLFLTAFADDETMFSSVVAGAAGYLLKQAEEESVVRAIETVAKGQSILDPAVTETLLQRVRSLSAQAETMLMGKTNKEIGSEMGLSEKTVKNYLSNIFQKLQVSRRSQAAALFERQRAGH